jgi:hypothetical protein
MGIFDPQTGSGNRASWERMPLLKNYDSLNFHMGDRLVLWLH